VKNKYRSPYNAYYIILLSFIGYFVIRGNVEQIEPNLLGVYAGLLLAMKNK
ncbi:O-antigen ligase RfaL, partial [Escherichia coli]|nr:O-antigen ligase RfaL [Escherichia coli]EFB8119949.1 O-antigen ligase RfaL [Escherichia coli]HAM0443030.1 O-antigen ligase RfaL [Escherichia coli]